jgi:hypothetical protein
MTSRNEESDMISHAIRKSTPFRAQSTPVMPPARRQ